MIFDGLLARFTSTKNQTHHNFFLMAQLIPDQGPTNLPSSQSSQLQENKNVSDFLYQALFLGPLGPGFIIAVSVRCGLCII